jgi:hypothetical protein
VQDGQHPAVCPASLAAFIVVERVSSDPMLPLAFFRQAAYCAANGDGLVMGSAPCCPLLTRPGRPSPTAFISGMHRALIVAAVLALTGSGAATAFIPPRTKLPAITCHNAETISQRPPSQRPPSQRPPSPRHAVTPHKTDTSWTGRIIACS